MIWLVTIIFVCLLLLVISLLFNIQKCQRAEKALRSSEYHARKQLAELENIYKNTPVGLGLVDAEMRYIRINDFLAEMNGKSPDDHIGRTPKEVIPDIGGRLEKLYRQVFDSGNPVLDYELQGRTSADPEKDHFWLSNFFPLESAGKLSGVMTVVTDITARKQVEEELNNYRQSLEEKVKVRMAEVEEANLLLQQEIHERKAIEQELLDSEKIYRALIEKAGDAVFLLEAEGDDAGKIISTNQAAADMHGYSFDELLALNIEDLDSPEAAREMAGRIDRIMAGDWIKEEITHRKKDGTVFPVEISAGLLEIENRKYILAFDRDVTERKRVENDLVQAQKSEAIGTLAGGIAHDFNNILGTIIGYAEMLEMFDIKENSPAHPKLAELIRAAYRAKELVQQILTFSRRTKQERSPIQLEPLVEEILSFIKAILPPNIEVRYTAGRGPSAIMADPTQIHQVLMNLATNAMHAMENAGGVLSITVDEMDIIAGDIPGMMLDLEQGKYVKLTISDTGVGMEQEVMERVFDPYFTTKETGEGTGMGLAVVQGIVKNHGGTITVESGIGIGSVFQVFFPKIEHIVIKEEEVYSDKISSGKERILFVDDEKSLVEIGKNMLEQCGYRVIATTDSIEALEIFKKQPDQFDLVITDQVMPKMKGDDLVRKLFEIKPDIPVILCTGFSKSITEEKAKEIGIREFLMKPLGTTNLSEIVRKVLDENQNHKPV